MVEINNQRKAFLDMLAWSEGTDNGRQKTRNHGYDVIVEKAIYWLLRSPSQTCHAKPKTQINRRRTLPASFPLVGCLPQAAGLKDFSPKVRTLWHCSRLRSVALYLWLIVVISVRQSTVAAIWASLPGVYGQFEHYRLTADCKIQRSGRNGQRDWCMSRVTAIISVMASASSSACHGLLIITVITPLPTKPSATKMPERTEAGERGNYWHADASAWCCCARCKIHRRS